MPETRQQNKSKKIGTEALNLTKSEENPMKNEGRYSGHRNDEQDDSSKTNINTEIRVPHNENRNPDESGKDPTKNQENVIQSTEIIQETVSTTTSRGKNEGTETLNPIDSNENAKTEDNQSEDCREGGIEDTNSQLQEGNQEENPRDYENEHDKTPKTATSTILAESADTARHGKIPVYPGRSSVRKGFPETHVSKQDRPEIYSKLIYATIFAAVIVAVAAAFHYPKLRKEIKPETQNSITLFDNNLKTIQANFTNQTDKFWMVLRNRGLAHLRNSKPNTPLVFLLGAPPSAHSVVDCLAKKLAWSLDPEVTSSSFIDGSKYSKHGVQRESDDTFDTKLENILQNPSASGGGVRSALVMHLEKLPLSTAEVLSYKYCDNDDAPYKQAVIILTVHLPNEPVVLLSPLKAQQSITKFLYEVAWSGTDPNERVHGGLISRISGTEPLVNRESDKNIQLACKDL